MSEVTLYYSKFDDGQSSFARKKVMSCVEDFESVCIDNIIIDILSNGNDVLSVFEDDDILSNLSVIPSLVVGNGDKCMIVEGVEQILSWINDQKEEEGNNKRPSRKMPKRVLTVTDHNEPKEVEPNQNNGKNLSSGKISGTSKELDDWTKGANINPENAMDFIQDSRDPTAAGKITSKDTKAEIDRMMRERETDFTFNANAIL